MIDNDRLQVATNRVWGYGTYLVLKHRERDAIQYRVFKKIESGLQNLLDCHTLEDAKSFIQAQVAAPGL